MALATYNATAGEYYCTLCDTGTLLLLIDQGGACRQVPTPCLTSTGSPLASAMAAQQSLQVLLCHVF